MGRAQRDVPVDALLGHVDWRELDGGFPTVGLLLAGVERLARHTHGARRGDDGEQRVGVLDIIVEREVEAVAQGGDVGTNVVVDGLLPCQLAVAKAADDDTRTKDVGHQAVEHVCGVSLVSREVLVARVAHRAAELQHLEDAIVAHPALVVDVPAQAHRPRGAETVVGAKHGGTVVAQVEVEQVAVVVGVAAVEVETGSVLHALAVTGLAPARVVVGKRGRGKLVVGEARGGIAVGLARGVAEVEAQHGVYLVLLGYQLAIGGRHVALIVEILLQAVGEQAFLRGVLVIKLGVFRRETLVLGVVVFGDAKLGAEAQVVGGEPLGYEVVGEAETLTLVVVVEVGVPKGVRHGAVVEPVLGIVEILVYLAVLAILLVVRVGLRILGEGYGWVVGLQIVDGELVAELELARAVNQVDVAAQRLAVGAFHHAVHLAIVHADAIAYVALATLGIDIVLVGEARAQGHAEPIGVHALLYGAKAGVVEVVELHLVEGVAGVVLVDSSQPLKLQLLARVHQVVVGEVGKVEAVVALV